MCKSSLSREPSLHTVMPLLPAGLSAMCGPLRPYWYRRTSLLHVFATPLPITCLQTQCCVFQRRALLSVVFFHSGCRFINGWEPLPRPSAHRHRAPNERCACKLSIAVFEQRYMHCCLLPQATVDIQARAEELTTPFVLYHSDGGQ